MHVSLPSRTHYIKLKPCRRRFEAKLTTASPRKPFQPCSFGLPRFYLCLLYEYTFGPSPDFCLQFLHRERTPPHHGLFLKFPHGLLLGRHPLLRGSFATLCSGTCPFRLRSRGLQLLTQLPDLHSGYGRFSLRKRNATEGKGVTPTGKGKMSSAVSESNGEAWSLKRTTDICDVGY